MKKVFLIIAVSIGILILAIALKKPFLSTKSLTKKEASLKKTEEAINLAPDFPKIPIYPGAKLLPVSEDAEEGGIEIDTNLKENIKYRALWETNLSVPAIMQWYKNNITGEWIIEKDSDDYQAEGSQNLVFVNNNWRIYLKVQKNDIDKPTLIGVVIVPK